jgi:hypothetical protein
MNFIKFKNKNPISNACTKTLFCILYTVINRICLPLKLLTAPLRRLDVVSQLATKSILQFFTINGY